MRNTRAVGLDNIHIKVHTSFLVEALCGLRKFLAKLWGQSTCLMNDEETLLSPTYKNMENI